MQRFRFTLLFIVFGIQHLFAGDVLIKQATDHSLTIEFSPQQWIVSDKNIKNSTYKTVHFYNDDVLTESGQPMAPCRIVTIGIPLDARINMEIIESIPGGDIQGTLLPTPTPLPNLKYIEDRVFFHGASVFPGEIVRMMPPGFLRNQRIMQIRFNPVQFNVQSHTITLYKKITIRLTFNQTTPKTVTQKIAANKSETLFESLLLNYDQSRKWRSQRKNIIKSTRKASASATWYKISIKYEGIYKLTGKMLSDAGVPIESIDPATYRIYNNGGRELERDMTKPRPDSLIENALLVVDNADGKLDESDYILFYGKPVNGWDTNYEHYINHYTHYNIYWLTWGNGITGKRMENTGLANASQYPLISKFNDHIFLEEELYNPIESGIDWYGKSFITSGGTSINQHSYSFEMIGAVRSDTTKLIVRAAATTGGAHTFRIYFNEQYMGNFNAYGSNSDYMVISPKDYSISNINIAKDGYNKLTIEYQPSQTVAEAYLDWIEIHFSRKFIARENKLICYSPQATGRYQYNFRGFSSDDIAVFDITDFANVKIITQFIVNDSSITFADAVNTTQKKYLAITKNLYRTPEKLERDYNSDLRSTSHGADFVIITYDAFYEQALQLKSLRENCDNLKTEVVKISDVYDEFSWGMFDPVAIRDFLKYAYASWSIPPRYVLLFGSGDYDYRNIIDPIDHNLIPPFQTTDHYEGDSRTWDDWYGMVSGSDYLIDIVIGRLPARKPDQATNMVQKIINYKNNPEMGDWRNQITMVADDLIGEAEWGVEREHTEECESIAENYLPNTFNVNKIYLIDFPAVYTASITGRRKPAAQQAIIDAINHGCLIINYLGHGRYDLWAHEVVLDMDTDLQKINNGQRQALWIAGTCYFGRFDNPAYESMTEELMIMKANGAIAVIAAARLVGSVQNSKLNKRFYQKLFPTAYSSLRIGDALVSAKNSRGNYENDQKIILFADPTMHLANPTYRAKINDISPDTIKALSQLNISGEIDKDGSLWTDFNGQILLKGYDSQKSRIYPIEDGVDITYQLPGNTIFRGTATVENGEFTARFIVPKDITYGGEKGRFSLYFWDELVDGVGFRDYIPVGGTETGLTDHEGPQFNLRFNDTQFEDGGHTTPTPLLTVDISDSLSGINITGDIGHSIIMRLDGEKTNLTELFNYNRDSYVAGTINKQIGPLNEGPHELSVKAWDNSNNSSENIWQFFVIPNDKLVIDRLLNYPNPFATDTDFTFYVSNDCNVTIKIYTVAGRLIKKIDGIYAQSGYNQFHWDGRDGDGEYIANGVYLYKIFAKTQLNTKTVTSEAIEKLMIIR